MAANDGETYDCLVDGCTRSFSSKRARGSHQGMSHTDAEKREICIAELQRLSRTHGRTPRAQDLKDYGKVGLPLIERLFECWNNALRAAGFEVTETWEKSADEVLSEIQRLADDLGRTPKYDDMEEHSSIGSTVVEDKFGSWNNGLREAGFEPTHVTRGESSGVYYGTNWPKQRATVVDRDNNQCRTCHKQSTEIENMSVHVHHITPARTFGVHDEDVDADYEEMNDLSNLICLCPSCHSKLEGKFQDADPDEFAELGREELKATVPA